MRSINRILLSVLIMTCFGCIPIGDGVMKVKGKVVDAKGKLMENCLLELYWVKKDTPLQYEKISGYFKTSFTVSPRSWPCPDFVDTELGYFGIPKRFWADMPDR